MKGIPFKYFHIYTTCWLLIDQLVQRLTNLIALTISYQSEDFVTLPVTSFWFALILPCWSCRWCCLFCKFTCGLLLVENLLTLGLSWNCVTAIEIPFRFRYFCVTVITGYVLIRYTCIYVFKGTFWSISLTDLNSDLCFSISSWIRNGLDCSSGYLLFCKKVASASRSANCTFLWMALSLVDNFNDLELDDLYDDLELVGQENDDLDFFLSSLYLISFL